MSKNGPEATGPPGAMRGSAESPEPKGDRSCLTKAAQAEEGPDILAWGWRSGIRPLARDGPYPVRGRVPMNHSDDAREIRCEQVRGQPALISVPHDPRVGTTVVRGEGAG